MAIIIAKSWYTYNRFYLGEGATYGGKTIGCEGGTPPYEDRMTLSKPAMSTEHLYEDRREDFDVSRATVWIRSGWMFH